MKLSKILDAVKPFAEVAASLIPGGPALVAAVNTFLPDSKKLPEHAKGGEILSAIDSLPSDQRASLMSKEIDLEAQLSSDWTARYKAMAAADGQSTRPRIGLMMAWLLVFETTIFMILLAWGVHKGGIEAISRPDLWTVFASLTALPAGILGKYFGELRKEQTNRTVGKPTGALSGLLGMISK